MLKEKDIVYYLGFGYGFETFIYRLYEDKGIQMAQLNDGTIRSVESIENESGDVFLTKESINKRLATSWKAKLL